jgi:hypothetical protein
MESCYNLCSLGGVERQPTAIIGDRASFEGYISVLTPIERLNREAKATGGDIGFLNDAIAFKAASVMYDEQANPARMYFLNPEFLKLYWLRGAWLKMKAPVEPANQFTIVNRVLTVANLCATARRHLGVVTGIN